MKDDRKTKEQQNLELEELRWEVAELREAEASWVQADKELQQKEAHLAETQSLAHLGSYEYEVHGGEVIWSKKTFRIIERDLSLGEPSIEEYLQIVHPEDRSLMQSIFAQAVNEKQPFDFEYRIVIKDGIIKNIQSIGKPVVDENGNVVRIVGTILDITKRKLTEKTLLQLNNELELLNRAGKSFSSSLDLDQVLTNVLEEVRRLMDVTASSIWLIAPENDELVCRQVTHPKREIVRGWRLELGEGIVGWVVRHGKSLIVPDVRKDERHFKGVDKKTKLALRSILSVPLKVQQNMIGAIQVVDTAVDRFDQQFLTLIEPLAASAAIAIENARLYEQAQQEIAERKQAEQRLEHLATHDPLTDLPNRNLYYDRLNHAISLARRDKRMVAVFFIDLDGFKSVNDAFGHKKGDQLLQEVTERLKSCMRESDTVARLSGDEFTACLENISKVADATAIAEKILTTISQPFVVNGQDFVITASIGISLYPQHGDDADSLLKNADAAMYAVKEADKNGYRTFS